MSKPASIIYLPVRRHIRQFLLVEFGADPHHIDQRTYLGKQVAMVAEKQPYRLLRAEPKIEEPVRYGILLPKALKHYSITEDGRRQLGDSLEKYFQDVMVNFIKGQVAVTQNELGALKSFFSLYNINPDHYDLEAGRKQYRDYKDRVLRYNGQFSLMYPPQTDRLHA